MRGKGNPLIALFTMLSEWCPHFTPKRRETTGQEYVPSPQILKTSKFSKKETYCHLLYPLRFSDILFFKQSAGLSFIHVNVVVNFVSAMVCPVSAQSMESRSAVGWVISMSTAYNLNTYRCVVPIGGHGG